MRGLAKYGRPLNMLKSVPLVVVKDVAEESWVRSLSKSSASAASSHSTMAWNLSG